MRRCCGATCPQKDAAAVAALVRASAGKRCITGMRVPDEQGLPTAVRGDDGRYHLVVGGRPQCSDKQAADGTWPHRQWCRWWTDGDGYRIEAPPGAWDMSGESPRLIHGQRGDIDLRWSMTLSAASIDPALVLRRERCPEFGRLYWPAFIGTDAMGKLRARLVKAFGPLCAACRVQPAGTVDHDHFTGYVRRLLCLHCNTHLDDCPHLDGCAFADYLNNPPAAAWKVFYPKAPTPAAQDSPWIQAKIAAMGYDPLWRSRAQQLAKEPHLPAPAQAAGIDLSSVTVESLF